MGVSLASVIVLARLLVPEDFGLLASIAPLVAFVGLFQNLGLHQAIVQRTVIEQVQLDQIFWLTALVAVLATGIVLALAVPVASFYGDPRIVGIMAALSVTLTLGGLSAVPNSLLARELRFGALAAIDVVALLAGFIAAVLLAANGYGYWALVAAAIVTSALTLVLSWWLRPWRPASVTFRMDRDIVSFGANLTGFNLVNFLSRNLDNVLIGRVLGLTQLGYYDRAYRLLLFPLEGVTRPLGRVMVPLLSRVQDDGPRFAAMFSRTVWTLALVMLPGVAAVTMTAPQVVAVLFGERWAPVAPIFAWLGLAGFSQVVMVTNGWIFICQGRTDTMFRLGLYSSTVTIVSFVVGLPWGVTGVAASYTLMMYALRLPVTIFVVDRLGPIPGSLYLRILGTFALAAAASYVALRTIGDLPFLRTRPLVLVAASVATNYALAFVLVMALGTSRRILIANVRQVIATVVPRRIA